MLLSPEDAQEAAQETFLKVYQALNRFNGRYQMGAWITRIATNVCLDHLRSTARRPSAWAPFEEIDEKELPRLGKFDEEPETFVIKKSEGRRVIKVLRSLPPLHRAAIVLRDFEGLPYCEIAIALGVSEAQVKALLHRARNGFKKSWSTTGLAAFLPWNVVARFRKPDATLVEPAANAATSATHLAQVAAPATNVATSCASALQQCGQAITERFATAVTAAIVGTAAITGVATSSASPRQPIHVHRSVQVPQATDETKVLSLHRELKRHHKKKVVAAPAPAPVASPLPESAEPEPHPVPTATPQDPEAPEGEGTAAEPKPKPHGPVAPAVGWERGTPIPETVPVSNQMTIDCAAKSFSQRLETTISDGSASYPAVLTFTINGASSSLDLTVRKDNQDTTYNGGSSGTSLTASSKESVWSATGSYSSYGANQPSYVGLPSSGRFTFRMEVDCNASSVVTESVSFTTA
jgi:RNA polymerase sigma-70 factor (ECF subfamily)